MKKKWFSLSASALAFIIGCATGPETLPTASKGSEAVAQISTNLQRLRDLQVFAVGSLVERAPESALHCYGLPCNDDDRRVVEAARVVQAERLAEFAELSARAVDDEAPANACEPAAIDANLERLSGLGVVTVEGLLTVEAESQPNCYNLPCPDDIERAKATNCERAKDLAAIVAAAQSMSVK